MKTILTSCIILFLCISDIKAQAETKSAYVSLHGGLIYVSSDSFSKVYNSRFGFIFGGGIGLPISTRLSLYAKAALFRKSGVPVIYNYKFENNNWILESETKDGSAEFRQWLFNFGLQRTDAAKKCFNFLYFQKFYNALFIALDNNFIFFHFHFGYWRFSFFV